MNVILLHGEWLRCEDKLTSDHIGIRHKLQNVYEVIDKPLFFLSVIKYGIPFIEVECPYTPTQKYVNKAY